MVIQVYHKAFLGEHFDGDIEDFLGCFAEQVGIGLD
jgi:hypothetical protein